MQEEKNPIVEFMCRFYNVNDFVWVVFTVVDEGMCLQITFAALTFYFHLGYWKTRSLPSYRSLRV